MSSVIEDLSWKAWFCLPHLWVTFAIGTPVGCFTFQSILDHGHSEKSIHILPSDLSPKCLFHSWAIQPKHLQLTMHWSRFVFLGLSLSRQSVQPNGILEALPPSRVGLQQCPQIYPYLGHLLFGPLSSGISLLWRIPITLIVQETKGQDKGGAFITVPWTHSFGPS